MRKLFSSKKRIAMAAGVLVVALGASAAFAYWTASGTGSGNASTGTDAGVTIDHVVFSGGPDTITPGTLYPGATVNVAFNVNNSSSNTAVNVWKVVADTSTYTNGIQITGPANAVANCDPSWFSYSGTTLAAAPGKHIAANGTYSAPAGAGTGNGGTLTMTDDSTHNQDACKNASFTLHLTTDNSGI